MQRTTRDKRYARLTNLSANFLHRGDTRGKISALHFARLRLFPCFPILHINNDIIPSGTASGEVINKNIRYGGMAPLIAEWNFYSEDKDGAVSIKMQWSPHIYLR